MAELLSQAVVNVLVGNADGHLINTSVMIDQDGSIRLSPIYDIFSSFLYPVSKTLGLYVNDLTNIMKVTPADVVVEGIRWGLDRQAAHWPCRHSSMQRLPQWTGLSSP